MSDRFFVSEFPRELVAALRGRFFSVRALVTGAAPLCVSALCFLPAATAASAAAQEAGGRAPDAAGTDPGQQVLVGDAGSGRVTLVDCPSGRRLAHAPVPGGLAAAPVLAGPLAHAVTSESALIAYRLPGLERIATRRLPFAPSHLTASDGLAGLVAVGGGGPAPLLVVDARTLADVHVYRPERATTIGALAHVPGRASFLAGLARPESPAEVWELAHDANAPPVLKGLVHDYRMGEAVALPGRFTPRVAPVASPTAALVAGPVPYEWLRVDAVGQPTVLHLEIRREIARLPDPAGGAWLAAPWQGSWNGAGSRGWLVGMRGGRSIRLFESGSWQLTGPIALPGPLLALRSFVGNRSVLAAVAHDDGVALMTVDGPGAPPVRKRVVAARTASPRLLASQDGRCIALVDEAGEWLGSVRSGR